MGGTVLIFRTRPDVDDTWSGELEERGYCVLSAEEPGQALVHVRSGGVDVILIDGPGDGVAEQAMAGFLGSLGDEADAPPFVLISGSPSAPLESARLGAAAFVPKPCTADDLDSLVARMVRKPQLAPKRTRRQDYVRPAVRAVPA